MNPDPLLIDAHTSLQDLGRIVAEAETQHLADGFIVVADGRYQGIGTSQDLMREITQMQIQAARHANALSGLPSDKELTALLRRLLA